MIITEENGNQIVKSTNTYEIEESVKELANDYTNNRVQKFKVEAYGFAENETYFKHYDETILMLRKRKSLGIFECGVVPRVINIKRV